MGCEGPPPLPPLLPSAGKVDGALSDSAPLPLLGGSRPAAKQRRPAGEVTPPTGVGGAEERGSKGAEPPGGVVAPPGGGVALLPAVAVHLSQVPSESMSQ